MILLRLVDWIIGFVIGSLCWTLFLLSLPLILVAFFVYQIFWNTHRFFFFWLPLTPGLLVDMWYDVPVGRFFLSVWMIIVGWWIVYPVLRWVIHRKLRKWE